MADIIETTRLVWDAEQPAQVARTLLASVNEMDAALGKLGSQTAAAFAAGMQTHLSSVREQVTGLRLEFERLGIVMGQTGRAPLGAGGFPSPVTAPLGAAMPTRTAYWGDTPLPEGYTPGVGGGDRPFSPGFGGNWVAAGAGYFYNPSTGRFHRGIGGPYASAREVSEAIQGFQYGGRGQPGTLPVPPAPSPSLMDEEVKAAFYSQYNIERGGIRRFGRLFGEQAPEAYYGTPGWERQYGFEAGIGGIRAQSQAQQAQIFGAMRAVGGQDYGQWRATYQEDPFSGLRAQAQAQQAQTFGAMRGIGQQDYEAWRQQQIFAADEQARIASAGRAVGRQDYESWRYQFQNMPIGQAIGAGYVAPARMPEAFAGGLGGIEQARWFEQQAYRMPGGMGAARAAVAGGLAPEEYEKLRRGGEAAYEAQEKLAGGIRKTGEETDLLTNRFTRHLTWIVQGILIWESFRVVGTIIRDVASEFIALEAAAARVAYVTGTTVSGAMNAVFGQVVQGARYGIQPGISQQGAITAAQFGLTPQQQDEARQMALVFGAKEYDNILKELYQTEQRRKAENIGQINTLGYLASAVKVVSASFEEYMDALQAGESLQSKLGISAEQTGLAILKITAATEIAPDTVGDMLQRVTRNIARPEVQQLLSGEFGIKPGAPAQMWREIAEATRTLVGQGQIEQADRLMQIIFGGSLQAGRQLANAKVAVMELGNALYNTQPMENWNKVFQNQLDTTQTHVQQLGASWSTFLASLSVTPGMKNFFEWLNNQITGTAAALLRLSQGGQAQGALAEMTPTGRLDVLQQFIKESGGGSLRGLFDVQGGKFVPKPEAAQFLTAIGGGNIDVAALTLQAATGFQGDQKRIMPDIYSFLEFAAQGRPGTALTPGMPGFERPGFGARAGGGLWGGMPPAGPQTFEGPWNFRDLPKDTTFETLRTAIDKWDKILAGVSPEYTAKYGAPGGERMEQTLTYFRDPLTNIFDKSISSQEALRMAIEELSKLERAKIIGVWNVPAGMDFMLPFAALLGNTGIPGGGAGGGGGGGTGTGGAGGRGQPSVSAMQYLMMGRQGPMSGPSGEEIVRQFLEANPSGGTQRPSSSWRFVPPQDRPYTPSRYERDEQFRRHNTDQMQSGNITINNRIIVQIDGKVVSTQLNRQLHMQNYGRNMVGGNPSSLLSE